MSTARTAKKRPLRRRSVLERAAEDPEVGDEARRLLQQLKRRAG